MSEFIRLVREMPPPFDMVVVIVVVGCIASLIGTVVYQVRLFADHEADRRLTRDLIDSGIAPEDAAQLVRSTPDRTDEETAA